MAYDHAKTKQEWCDYFKDLDIRFKTKVNSPLHHDNRCPLHAPEKYTKLSLDEIKARIKNV